MKADDKSEDRKYRVEFSNTGFTYAKAPVWKIDRNGKRIGEPEMKKCLGAGSKDLTRK